jgi:hypothetical protein
LRSYEYLCALLTGPLEVMGRRRCLEGESPGRGLHWGFCFSSSSNSSRAENYLMWDVLCIVGCLLAFLPSAPRNFFNV